MWLCFAFHIQYLLARGRASCLRVGWTLNASDQTHFGGVSFEVDQSTFDYLGLKMHLLLSFSFHGSLPRTASSIPCWKFLRKKSLEFVRCPSMGVTSFVTHGFGSRCAEDFVVIREVHALLPALVLCAETSRPASFPGLYPV